MAEVRNSVVFYLNGERQEVSGRAVFSTLSDYLRYDRRLTGTKVVCAEGDCGACTVFRAFPFSDHFSYEMINSCITSVGLMHGSHLVTIEGISREGIKTLTPVQESMIRHQGGQCGFCTPGFVMAMTDLYENKTPKEVDRKKIQNWLTGNLCRCTGYDPIIQAALNVDYKSHRRLADLYNDPKIENELRQVLQEPVLVRWNAWNFAIPVSKKDASRFCQDGYQIISSATDVGVQINKGRVRPTKILSLNSTADLYGVLEKGGTISVGAKVSLTRLQKFLKDRVPEMDRFLNIFASPQIKNAATLVGNLANASPIADTIPFLYVTKGKVRVQGSKERQVQVEDFIRGYKDLDLNPGEWISAVDFEVPKKNEYLGLYKASQRRDLDISCVNAAFVFKTSGERKNRKIESARVAYGGLGPTTLRLPKLEASLKGKPLTLGMARSLGPQIRKEVSPISDLRGNQEFRIQLAENFLSQFCWEHSA